MAWVSPARGRGGPSVVFEMQVDTSGDVSRLPIAWLRSDEKRRSGDGYASRTNVMTRQRRLAPDLSGDSALENAAKKHLDSSCQCRRNTLC